MRIKTVEVVGIPSFSAGVAEVTRVSLPAAPWEASRPDPVVVMPTVKIAPQTPSVSVMEALRFGPKRVIQICQMTGMTDDSVRHQLRRAEKNGTAVSTYEQGSRGGARLWRIAQ